MSELLVSRPGVLATVNNVGVPGLVKFNVVGRTGPLIASSAIITRISGNIQTNTRFSHALDNSVYVYSFGDRMGQATVSGLAFESDCRQISVGAVNPLSGSSLLTGLDQILLFYRSNRVSLSNFPVILFVGTISILRGYLVGIDFATQSTEMRSTAWTMRIAALPGAGLGFGRF